MATIQTNEPVLPPNVLALVASAEELLIPSEEYVKTFNVFSSWRTTQHLQPPAIEDHVLAFLSHQMTEGIWGPSTCWPKYSHLKKMLMFKENVDCKPWHHLTEFLKVKNKTYMNQSE